METSYFSAKAGAAQIESRSRAVHNFFIKTSRENEGSRQRPDER
jgi:hypothetical protein